VLAEWAAGDDGIYDDVRLIDASAGKVKRPRRGHRVARSE
jgi:hypothetical protein